MTKENQFTIKCINDGTRLYEIKDGNVTIYTSTGSATGKSYAIRSLVKSGTICDAYLNTLGKNDYKDLVRESWDVDLINHDDGKSAYDRLCNISNRMDALKKENAIIDEIYINPLTIGFMLSLAKAHPNTKFYIGGQCENIQMLRIYFNELHQIM